jgi:DNA-binding PadR family transcriptional regulator
MWGYKIKKQIETQCGIKLRHGALYPLLNKLERGGFLKSQKQQQGKRTRKTYTITEKGSIYYSDLVFLPTKELWLNLRVAFFRTDSYSSGIYEYERDLDGVLTQPVLYGKGVRWYLIIKYTFLEHLNLSAKFSDHIRDDVKKIGSGYDQLPTNHDDRISLQLDWRL